MKDKDMLDRIAREASRPTLNEDTLKQAGEKIRAAHATTPTRLCATVGDLREALADLPPDARIRSVEPPFEGVVVVEVDGGQYVICAPGREPKLSRR